jgi:hypothetical protein
MFRLFCDFYIDTSCMLLTLNRYMQLVLMFQILFTCACLSHQGHISSARFTSTLPIVPSQVVVLVKFDPLRPVGLPLVKFTFPSDRLYVKDLASGAHSRFYQAVYPIERPLRDWRVCADNVRLP